MLIWMWIRVADNDDDDVAAVDVVPCNISAVFVVGVGRNCW